MSSYLATVPSRSVPATVRGQSTDFAVFEVCSAVLRRGSQSEPPYYHHT